MALSSKNVVLTGCTAGIGQQIAVQLVPLGINNFILVNRNRAKTDSVISELRASGSNVQRFHSVTADCGEPGQMDRAVKEITAILEDEQNMAIGSSTGRGVLHIFINNAGIWQANKEFKAKSPLKNSKDQELHFATNYLSNVILANGLRPLLETATEESGGANPGRVIITGSFTSWEIAKGKLDVKNLSGEKHTSGKMPVCNDITYGQSKLCQHMWARWFARETSDPIKKLHVIVFCPGVVESSIDVVQTMKKMIPKCIRSCMMKFRVPEQAATIPAFLCQQEGAAFSQIEAFHGEAGLYCDCGKTGTPKLEKVFPPSGGVTEQNMKKAFLCRLETYPTYGRKTAPSTADWAKVEELVAYTEKELS